MRRARRITGLVCVIAALALIRAPSASAARTWTVIAGGGTRDLSVVSNFYHPRAIEVAVGDTVQWKFEGFHTVTFLGGEAFPRLIVEEDGKPYVNPRVVFPIGERTYAGTGYRNSGAPLDPSKPFSYSLTFTRPGTYRYVCIIHGPGMGGTVAVKDRVTRTPAGALRQGRREQRATIAAGQRAWASWDATWNGYTVTAPIIGDLKTGYSVLRFSPKPIVVPVGATVRWVNQDRFEVHTVTFTSGAKLPPDIMPEPQQQGPPKLAVNPAALAPTPAKTYDGAGLVNSGFMFAPGNPLNFPSSFSLTFTKRGRYEYWCIPHASLGMKGVVIVK